MVQYSSDQNRVSFQYESGAYANSLGVDQWPGLVQNNEIDETENITSIRYANSESRNVGRFNSTTKAYAGTLNVYPQDWKLLQYAFGKVTDGATGSPNFDHTFAEVNSDDVDDDTAGNFKSFTIFDGKKVLIDGSGLNFNRTVNGCVADTVTLNINEGEPASLEVSWIGQSLSYSSGAGPDPTENTDRCFINSDFVWHLESGNKINKATSSTITINNNLQTNYYVNESGKYIGEPIPSNRDYEITIEGNLDSDKAQTWYTQYFQGGSEFNMLLVGKDTSSTGSRDLLWTFSGCKMSDMTNPFSVEGPQTFTLTITPQKSSAVAYDNIELYSAW
jgi:hypothetical protein